MAELQARMSYAEFVDWLAYYQIEPFGGVRGDLHAALVAAIIANANRDPKKRRKPYTPGEFMPDWWKGKEKAEGPAHVALLLAKMQMLTDGGGGGDGEDGADADAPVIGPEPEQIGRRWR